jgi:hypothetical protein
LAGGDATAAAQSLEVWHDLVDQAFALAALVAGGDPRRRLVEAEVLEDLQVRDASVR